MDSTLEKELVSKVAAVVESVGDLEHGSVYADAADRTVSAKSAPELVARVADGDDAVAAAASEVETVSEPARASFVVNEAGRSVTQYRQSTPLGSILDPTYMDPALWKTMPMHVVELILSKVPFRHLVNLRRVCKYWNALILSEGFSPPFVPALIMFARTPTVRKMMWERNQPPPPCEAKEARKWTIIKVWNSFRSIFKKKNPQSQFRRCRQSSCPRRLHQRIPNSGILLAA